MKRGSILLDLDFVANWSAELKAMNQTKEGARFRYPESLVKLLSIVHAYILPYRQIEGFTRALSQHVDGLKAPDYTTIWWRVSKMKVNLDFKVEHGKDVTIAVDSSGSLTGTRFVTEGGVTSSCISPTKDDGGHVLQVLASLSYPCSYTITWDDSLSATANDWVPETGDKIGFCTNWINAQVQIDWVFLAKYFTPEPTQGSWGIEEGSGPAAPLPTTFVIWGTKSYGNPTDLTGGYPEFVLSESICRDVYGFATASGRFGYCTDNWGFDTQPNNVYNTAQYCEAKYSHSAIFYKGHSFDFYPDQDPVDPLSCTQKHYANYDNEGRYQVYSDYIKDYHIGENIYLGKTAAGKSSGTHDFVFLWTCGYGNEQRVGGSHGDHTYGMLASWMDIANPNTALSHDGYNSPDTTGKCFIGFDWLSRWFITNTENPSFNYGNFTSRFFYYALQPGMSINYGLNQAALYTTGYSFSECELYRTTGYQIWNGTQYVTSRMRVWGDGGYVLR